MTTGSWIPDSEKSTIKLPDESDLAGYAVLSEAQISELDVRHVNALASNITAGVDCWQPHLAQCDNATLEGLLKFFTFVEMAHPSLRADKHNPAIACAKLLRQRGHSIDKSILQWIRSVSDNRFLPYGPL